MSDQKDKELQEWVRELSRKAEEDWLNEDWPEWDERG